MSTLNWYTEPPEKEGEYLVTFRRKPCISCGYTTDKGIVVAKYQEDKHNGGFRWIVFGSELDAVIAWAEVEPYAG